MQVFEGLGSDISCGYFYGVSGCQVLALLLRELRSARRGLHWAEWKWGGCRGTRRVFLGGLSVVLTSRMKADVAVNAMPGLSTASGLLLPKTYGHANLHIQLDSPQICRRLPHAQH